MRTKSTLLFILVFCFFASSSTAQTVWRLTETQEGTGSDFERYPGERDQIFANDDTHVYYQIKEGSELAIYGLEIATNKVSELYRGDRLNRHFVYQGVPYVSPDDYDGTHIAKLVNGTFEIIYTSNRFMDYFTEFNGEIFFSDDEILRKIKADGTIEEVYEFYFFGGIRGIAATSSQMIIIGGTQEGRFLYTSDGTTAGTQPYIKINEGSEFNSKIYMTAVGEKVFFFWQPNDEDYSLWVTDGTEDGTMALRSFQPIAFRDLVELGSIQVYDGKFYFLGWNPGNSQNNYDFYVSDGTLAGTELVFPGDEADNAKEPESMTVYNDKMYFKVRTSSFFRRWYSLDGSNGTPERIWKDFSVLPIMIPEFDGKLLLSAELDDQGYELCTSEGTDDSTAKLTSISSGNHDALPFETTPVGDKIYFLANDLLSGIELHVYNPTLTSTEIVKPISYQVYPNPAANILTVEGLSSEQKTVTLTGANGQVIYSSNTANKSLSIDVSGIPSGAYTVTVTQADRAFTSKIIQVIR